MASRDTNTNNNANPAAHSLNIIPTKFGNCAVNSFSSTLAQVRKFNFLKNGLNDIDQILWVYSTFDAQQHDTISFSRKNP